MTQWVAVSDQMCQYVTFATHSCCDRGHNIHRCVGTGRSLRYGLVTVSGTTLSGDNPESGHRVSGRTTTKVGRKMSVVAMGVGSFWCANPRAYVSEEGVSQDLVADAVNALCVTQGPRLLEVSTL